MDSASPAAIAGLAQVALTMADVPAALVFYRDILGLRLLFSAGPDLAFLEAGGVRLMLTTPRGHGEPGKNSALYFRVQDLAAAYAAVVARGAAPERAPALTARRPDHELWMAFVRDPEGNLVGLMSEVRAPA
jgi:catechol 2,3-dioxygenase-like lactoylglutathione lyase family enzyme